MAGQNRENDPQIDTGGGTFIQGDVGTGGGDFAGRDKNVAGGELSAAFRAETINIYNAPASPAAPQPTPPTDPAPRASLPAVPCPYRGLEPFTVEHAANYFGRAAMVQKLLDKLSATNFVAVVGPSGSGKSSLVRAGLITALQEGKLPGSRTWDVAILRPGEDPLRALAQPLVERIAATLTPVDRLTETRKLADRLRDGSLPIGDALAHWHDQPTHPPHLLLLIDQFEETFTLCTDETLRRTFLVALLTAAETTWVMVIFTLRADFYGRILEDERFGKRVDAGLVNVLPMNETERHAAIVQPALNAGRRFEEGLVQRILDAVAAAPGELPLLEFALTELWERQTPDGLLTHAAYAAIGELTGAIAQRADIALKSFNLTEQLAVRKVFTRLVRVAQPDEGAEDTKRRVNLSELDAPLQLLVRKLADARLLVTDHDDETGAETVEVAHEALIRNWAELKKWLNGDREFLLWRQRLRTMVANWQASGRDAGALLRGALLTEGRGWLQTRPADLSEQERAFIAESQAAAEREVQEKEAVRQRELEQQRALVVAEKRRANTVRQSLVGVSILLIVAIIAAFYALRYASLANQKLADLKGTQLLDQARTMKKHELKTAEDVQAVIAQFKAAAAAPSHPTFDLQQETDDVLRQTAMQWVRAGEALARDGSHKDAGEKFKAAYDLHPPSDTLLYVWIPPGEFTMGSSITDTFANTNEQPQFTLKLAGFWIMRTEVTNAEYAVCVSTGKCKEPSDQRWNSPQFAEQPVADVDWQQANQYAAWVGGRLPSEAEWEKACRGTDARLYPWGDSPPKAALLNYSGSGLATWTNVGTYAPGTNSLYDMAGNVWEWTSSLWGKSSDKPDFGYPYDAKDGRENQVASHEMLRTLRGGAFFSDDNFVRCANRDRVSPDNRDYGVGFRVVSPGF